MRFVVATALGLVALVGAAMMAGCAAGGSEVESQPLTAALAPELYGWADQHEESQSEEWGIDPIPAPALSDIPYNVILSPDRVVDGSLSMGTASTGNVIRSCELPVDAETHFILSTHIVRDAYYGTDELCELLIRTGEALGAVYPGSRIPLGDLSSERGGDLRYHASHNSGRDVDIPFLVHSTTGRTLNTTYFATFDESGRAGRLVFDVERNWFLVRTLIEESNGGVQWIFVSDVLHDMLLAHGLESGEPKWILLAADSVMRQPSDSSPHDDHFHVRIYCSDDDRLEGCNDYGPVWAWAELDSERHHARVDELFRALSDERVETRVAAVEFIKRVDGNWRGGDLAKQLVVQPPEVQVAILESLQQFHTAGVGNLILDLVDSSDHPEVRLAALETAVSYPLTDASARLADLASRSGDLVDGEEPVSRLAARALLGIQDGELVPRLIPLLDSPDSDTRVLIARVLNRTTGRKSSLRWAWAGSTARRRAIDDWEEWYAEHADESREDWVRAAFSEAGYELTDPLDTPEGLLALIDAIYESEPIGYIAERYLIQLVGLRSPPAYWSHSRQSNYWLNAVEEYEN